MFVDIKECCCGSVLQCIALKLCHEKGVNLALHPDVVSDYGVLNRVDMILED